MAPSVFPLMDRAAWKTLGCLAKHKDIFQFTREMIAFRRAHPFLSKDTSRITPKDLFAAGEEPLYEDTPNYHSEPRSSTILLATETNAQTVSQEVK